MSVSHHFHMKRIVEFSETDQAGIVHFSNFFRYMEAVEHAFLRSLGLSVMMDIEGQKISWPRISCSFDYKNPIHFEQEIDIYLLIERFGKKSITYSIRIEHEEKIAAIGQLVVVCCWHNEGKITSVPIPQIFCDKIEPLL